jgi:flagellin
MTATSVATDNSSDAGAYAVVANATVDSEGVYTHDTGLFKFTLDQATSAGPTDTAIVISNGSELTLQVGANTGASQTIKIGINSLSASGLGISNLKVLDHAKSQESIDSIESAIQQVSNQRSSLGAVQNRLEHTVANLDTVAENLQSAESRIRDVDMAKEMMAFTKNNILAQAATAMLAQANQAPQTVLQLLQ